MDTYKVTFSRNITQTVEYIVKADNEDEAEDKAYEMCREDIDSGNVTEEHINEVGSGDNPVELIDDDEDDGEVVRIPQPGDPGYLPGDDLMGMF